MCALAVATVSPAGHFSVAHAFAATNAVCRTFCHSTDVDWLAQAGIAGHSINVGSKTGKVEGRRCWLWVAGVAKGKSGESLYLEKGLFDEKEEPELQRDFGFDLCQMCHHSSIEIKGHSKKQPQH